MLLHTKECRQPISRGHLHASQVDVRLSTFWHFLSASAQLRQFLQMFGGNH
jgi:hypothetical protein